MRALLPRSVLLGPEAYTFDKRCTGFGGGHQRPCDAARPTLVSHRPRRTDRAAPRTPRTPRTPRR